MKSASRRVPPRRLSGAMARSATLPAPSPKTIDFVATLPRISNLADPAPAPAPEIVAPPATAQTAVAPVSQEAKAIEFPELRDASKGPMALPIAPLMDVNLRIRVVLGETTLSLGSLLKLGEGSVIELSNSTGEPINIYVNDRLYARGEIVVVDDMFGVRLSEILDGKKAA